MSILEDWKNLNKMNPAFMVGELCRIYGLTMVSANGVISFTGGNGSALAEYVVGKTFDFNLQEIMVATPKVVVPPVVVKPLVPVTPVSLPVIAPVVTVTKVEESGITADLKPVKE